MIKYSFCHVCSITGTEICSWWLVLLSWSIEHILLDSFLDNLVVWSIAQDSGPYGVSLHASTWTEIYMFAWFLCILDFKFGWCRHFRKWIFKFILCFCGACIGTLVRICYAYSSYWFEINCEVYRYISIWTWQTMVDLPKDIDWWSHQQSPVNESHW